MKTIFKYALRLADTQQVRMPKGAKILCAQNQNGVIAIWALVDGGADRESRTIRIYGTGEPIAESNLAYIGTIQLGEFVWHVFEHP